METRQLRIIGFVDEICLYVQRTRRDYLQYFILARCEHVLNLQTSPHNLFWGYILFYLAFFQLLIICLVEKLNHLLKVESMTV